MYTVLTINDVLVEYIKEYNLTDKFDSRSIRYYMKSYFDYFYNKYLFLIK